jgi:MFS family permease
VNDAPAAASPADIERRAVWLAVAAALVMVVRGGGGGFFAYSTPEHLDRQLWFFIASTAALGASVLVAGLVALPEYLPAVARIGARWGPRRVFGWALLLFVAGVVIMAIAGIWSAADALGSNPSNG